MCEKYWFLHRGNFYSCPGIISSKEEMFPVHLPLLRAHVKTTCFCEIKKKEEVRILPDKMFYYHWEKSVCKLYSWVVFPY